MTERFRFTHDKITRVASRDHRFIVWDSTHRGLGLRITPRGTRSFIVAYRFNGRPRMLTLGNAPPLTLEQALERYSDALKSVAQARQMRVHEHETPPAELDPARRKRERREARR
ncbi:MAG TPA: Arm DNA-binding domain-containing protein, partial [Casimicrobiaceae bacterium]|nr:Arm DNA-binding domain-containing protein [Casimicrobiaceae bacterium]